MQSRAVRLVVNAIVERGRLCGIDRLARVYGIIVELAQCAGRRGRLVFAVLTLDSTHT
jgi:hypothetical protein